MSPPPRFLSVDDVVRLHAIAIENQGGDRSIRDRGSLESAVATPAQQFSDQAILLTAIYRIAEDMGYEW